MHEWIQREFEILRTTVHDELAGVRKDMSGLAGEVRGHIPRIAVLEHRADGHDREIRDLKRERSEDRTHRRWSVGTWISAALGALAILATLVIGILNLIQAAGG